MRRLLLATAALVPVAALPSGCGGTNPRVEEPLVRTFLKDLNRALITDDKEKVARMVLPTAGQRGNPVGASGDKDTINDGNRRLLRQLLLDCGVMKPTDLKLKASAIPDEPALTRFDEALHISIVDMNARASFEIAGEGRRRGEQVILSLVKDPKDGTWRMYDYEREMKAR